MRVLLFNPMAKFFYKPMTSPLGILSIASYLNANGHCAVICDRFYSKKSPKKIISEFKPDVIGVSIIANQFLSDARDISVIAKSLGVPVVWGGPVPSEIPQAILESGVVDYVSINEGEQTWLEMAQAFESGKSFADIKGLAYIKDGELILTGERDFLDLSELPPIDWNLIDVPKYFQPYYQARKMLYVYSSKGCVGNCAFCYNATFHKSKHRVRPCWVVLEEIKYLIKEYGLDGVNFSDDLIFSNKAQMKEFCNTIIDENIKFYWGGSFRVGIIETEEEFELMYKAGCRWLQIGVETGSVRMQKVISKNVSLDKITQAFEYCDKLGITVIASVMVGLPGETTEDLKQTVQFAKNMKATVCAFNFFVPIQGTKIYNDLVAQGKYSSTLSFNEHKRIMFGEKMFCNVSNVPSADIKAVWKYFMLRSLLFKEKRANDGEYLLGLKLLKNAFKSISGHGLLHFLRSGFYGVYDLLYSMTLFLHPKIRQKYGLYFK